MRITLVIAAFFVMRASAGTVEIAQRDVHDRGEPTLQLKVVGSVAPWLRKVEYAGVVYFLYSSPARVERYELASQSWLPAISLSAAPRGIGVSNAGIIVNQSTKVSRFDLTGSFETLLPTVWSNADDVAILGDHLLSVRNRKIQSVRLSDMTQVAVYENNGIGDPPSRISVAIDARAIYGWRDSTIVRISVHPDGSFGAWTAPFHFSLPDAYLIYPDRDGVMVLDDAGIGYNGATLSYLSGTGGPINDTVTAGNERFVLRPNSIARLSPSFRETGHLSLDQEAHGLAVFGDRAFLFAGSTVQVIPLSRFSEPASLSAPNPAQSYTADSMDLADDGTLYLFNKVQRVVHRFSVPQWRYLPSVALPQKPLFASVDRANSRVYVAYENGRLGVIPRNAQAEQFLAFGPSSVISLVAADEFAITSDFTGGGRGSPRVYNQAGIQTAWGSGEYTNQYSWSRQNRRLYFFASTNALQSITLSGDGQILASAESPNGQSWSRTIKPSPTGAVVYLGSGKAFDGNSLILSSTLPLPLLDAIWLGNVLYTTEHTIANTGRMRIIRWNQNNSISAEAQIAGDPIRLFAVGPQIVSAANVRGRTVIQRWPGSLAGTNVSVEITSISPPAASGSPISFTVEVTNQGFENAGNVNVAVALSAPVQQLTWLCDALQGSVPCGSSTGLQLSIPLSVGETFRASAFGLMSPSTVGFQASASLPTGDIDPADNTIIGQLRLLDTIFAQGFE